MEERSVDGYIWIGTSVRFLIDVRQGYNFRREDGVATNIEDLVAHLDLYGFHVTRRVAEPLHELLLRWKDEAREHSGANSAEDHAAWLNDDSLSEADYAVIDSVSSTLRTTLLAEAEGKIAFIVQDKRFAVEKLLGDVGSLMSAGVFARLPDIAREDLDEAGKCVAFQRPTAAAFHLMRAVEGVLRWFYLEIVKRGRIAEPRMWAAMTTQLASLSKPIPKTLLDNLDHVRQNFRNPTQHPDKVYDNDEAQDLMALSIDVINRMVKHLDERAA